MLAEPSALSSTLGRVDGLVTQARGDETMTTYTTIQDLYARYCDLCGEYEPLRTRDEVQDEFHRRGYGRYDVDGEQFLDEIFDDGWVLPKHTRRQER